VTISHVAAACGSIQSASPRASFDAWWSMTTRGEHEQVVLGRGVWVGPEPLGTLEERIQRRYGIRADRISRAAEPLDQTDDAERGAQCVGVRVLMRDRQDTSCATHAVDDDVGNRIEVRRQVDAHRVERRGRGLVLLVDRP
jgi:hypothetical protein